MTLRKLDLPGLDSATAERQARTRHEDEQRRLLPHYLRLWRLEAVERDWLLSGKLDVKREAITRVRAFSQSPKRTLSLWGENRGGKTLAACYWMTLAGRRWFTNDIVGRSWAWDASCRFLPAITLARIQSSYVPEDRQLLADAVAARALVVDDVGNEPRPCAAGLTELLYQRTRSGLWTLITTNTDPMSKPFAARYDQRTVTRLREGEIWGVLRKGAP